MRLSKRKRATRPNVDITPMIDIVFLLLIFFITVTQITEANNDPVELPPLSGSVDQEPAVLTINIRQGGEIVIGGRVYSQAGFLNVVTRVLASVDDDPARIKVVIRGDHRVNAGVVNEVVTSLGRLEITRIRLAVQADE